MTGYLIRRVLWLIPVLLFISLVTFTLMHAVEGGPWDDGQKLTDVDRERLNARYGLDDPVWRQYLNFLTDAMQGDLGVSFQRQTQDVRTIIWDGFKVSAVLGGLALAVSLVLGVPLGVLSAVKKNGPLDYAAVLLSTLGAAVPSFVLGIGLILLFAVRLDWVPVNGWGTPKEAIMPVIALAFLPVAFLARITRASMLEVLRQDYVRTARSKGLGEFTVLTRHTIRNAVIPVLTVIGPLAAGLITGSFIIEQMFGIPGLGRQFITSVTQRDYGVIMGTTLFYAALVALANLLVDITYAVVDPRIKYS
jgi:oligopeptide transport system permease protein